MSRNRRRGAALRESSSSRAALRKPEEPAKGKSMAGGAARAAPTQGNDLRRL